MATRKKKSKVKTKAKPRAKAKVSQKKAPAKKKKKAKRPAFEEVSTQQLAVAEIIGDIEERMALDRLAEPK